MRLLQHDLGSITKCRGEQQRQLAHRALKLWCCGGVHSLELGQVVANDPDVLASLGLLGGVERLVEQHLVDASKLADGELFTTELGGKRGSDHQIAQQADGCHDDVFMVELKTVGACQHVDDRAELHPADVPNAVVWVVIEVAVVADHCEVGNGDGSTTTGVAVKVTEGRYLVEVVFGEVK
ncbi:MAG: hypothetical protein EBZ98_00805 [Actinobacteria bacterium]|nr:hypothetical protein [Actinomycetota bacterium]